jgi:signal transduction histidine kinase
MANAIILHHFSDSDLSEDLRQKAGEQWAVVETETPEDLESALEGRLRAVTLYPAGLDARQRAALVDFSDDTEHQFPLVAVIPDGEAAEAVEAVRSGADDYLFEEQLASEHWFGTLEALLNRHDVRRRDQRLHRELKGRSTELLGLNALANGVSSSLDRETIVRRGLWVFAGVCQQKIVSLLDLKPPLDLLEDSEDLPSVEPGHHDLECVTSFSAGGGEMCGDLSLNEEWASLVNADRITVLHSEEEARRYPGLEPFWEYFPDGQIQLLPLRANKRPIGVLALGDGGEQGAEPRVSSEGLRAMALQFASALDNARLFAEVKEAYESLQRAQDQLVHAEKFAAVGLLAAEIAHEINNPASFVISNLSVMLEYTETIVEFLDALEDRLRDGVEDGAEPLTAEGFEAMRQTYDIGYLKEDMESLLSRSMNGMQRIHQIVQDLRYLSRDSGEEAGWLDLQSLLDATVNLVSHEAKFRADIVLEYGDVPQIMSDASRLSQVFLNLMVNAVQAIEDDNVQDNEIKVQTRMADEEEGIVEVVISDTGKGIPEEAQDKIFDAFFTTKETGEGTGLGLSISQDIIRSLGGSIDFETERGVGTTFYVRLPIRAEKFQEDENLRDSGYYDSPPELDRVEDDLFEQS